jgi:hypothetical protein
MPVIYATSCDQMRRAADAVMGGSGNGAFLYNLPVTWQNAVSRRLYRTELERLSRFLQRHGGCTPTADGLRSEMCNRDKLRQEIGPWVQHGAARQVAEAMTAFLCGTPPAQVNVQPRQPGIPIAMVGGPLCASQWDVFDMIEAMGGCVVLNAVEPGERCLLPTFPTAARARGQSIEGLLSILCDHYFDHMVDVFHRPNSRLYTWLQNRLAVTGARGIILWVHVAATSGALRRRACATPSECRS